MKFLNNNLKAIIAFFVGLILAGGIVYAAVTASDIDYTTEKNANVKNVEQALNDLYSKKELSSYRFKKQLIPNMTSNTTPSGSIETSSTYTGRHEYSAFSGVTFNLSDGNTFWYTDKTDGEYISYTWDKNVYVGYISFQKHVKNSLTIEYLNSSNQWTEIKSYPSTGNTDTTSNQEYYLPNLVSTNSIRFRFDTGSFGFLASVKIGGLELAN